MAFDNLDDLYRDVILDHCRHPRHQDKLEDADLVADGVNPFCGDEIHLQINLDESGRVVSIGFQGQGCSINQASGSMLSEAVEGKTLDEIETISTSFHDMMQGEPPLPGDLGALSGVLQFPIRIKCALLSWATLQDAIEEYRKTQG